jgi:hypothetical protein
VYLARGALSLAVEFYGVWSDIVLGCFFTPLLGALEMGIVCLAVQIGDLSREIC